MKKLASSLILSVMLIALMFGPARADVAPPESPPGSSLLPGDETTQVAMMAETVTLTVLPDPTDPEGAVAKTVASFTMRNLGTSAEQMQVRFPLSFLLRGSEAYPEIGDLQARVNGRSVPTTRQVIPYASSLGASTECMDCPVSAQRQIDIPWAVFGVDFPPAEDVSIEVSYTVQGFGYYPYEVFRYVLETGAGWKDTIGSADVIVRLPYEANRRNVWASQTTGYSETSPGYKFSVNEVRWHFENLEPTPENNIQISLVTPPLWQKVLKETANVTQNPQDGEAWGRLGKDYKEIIRMSKGYLRDDADALEMYALSKDAYERCLALLPKDSLWHTGYADLLWAHYYFDIYFSGRDDTEGILPLILSELQTALKLDPNNQLAKDMMEWILSAIPGAAQRSGSGYDFLGLTATPIPPTPFAEATETESVPTPTLVSTLTQAPSAVATPVSTPTDQGSPLCGGTAMILPTLAGLLWVSRRRKQTP